jgi:Ca-activated chloride channel family protein
MQPTVKFDRTLVTVLVDEVVHVMLELAAPPATPMQRAPLDVVVVLDRSGSMAGQPLAAVTQATAQLLRLAGNDDRLGVVAFDDEVQMVLPLGRHDADRDALAVLQLQPGGMTNLSGGWLKGLEMLTTDVRPDALRRIILLTDGQANTGITGVSHLAPLVKSGHAQGVTTSFIGFSDNYDEVLLAALADAGMGNDYWCAGPDQAAQVFADEFGGLASVVAQNVSVEIAPSDAVAATAVLNEFPVTQVANGVQVALGDAYGGEHRRVVAKFHLRPITADGPIDVATLTIRWVGTAGDVSLHTVTVPVVVTAGAANGDAVDPGVSPEVTEEVLRLEVAKARRDAREAAERGDHDTAAGYLRRGATAASSLPMSEALVHELTLDADRLTDGQWDAGDAKRHMARSRGASKGRRTEYSADTDEHGNPI